MRGRIYKISSNEYTVKSDSGEIFVCAAKGALKIKGDGLSVGDLVELGKEGVIIEVIPRKNRFNRPNVSNADLILVVISPLPEPDFYLVDKVLVNAAFQGVQAVIAVNKTDIGDALTGIVESQYGKAGVKILSFSAVSGEGKEKLEETIKGKLTVLAGQSAAGKTSVVKALFGIDLKTGDVSRKTGRGKHTTTCSEIFEKDGFMIVDTPGFAAIDAAVPPQNLPSLYPEYAQYAGECRFRGCRHITEPDCKIKELVEAGELSCERYERYKKIYSQLLAKRRDYEKD